MALLSFRMVDYNGTRRTAKVHLPDGMTLAEYTVAAQEISSQLDNVTGCRIQSSVLEFVTTPAGGLKAVPDDAVEAERGGLLQFATAGRYNYGFWFPGVLETFVAGQELDVSGALATVRDLLIGPLSAGAGDAHAHDGYGNDVESLVSTKKTFRPK